MMFLKKDELELLLKLLSIYLENTKCNGANRRKPFVDVHNKLLDEYYAN